MHVGSYPLQKQKRWNFEKILDDTPAIPMLVKLIGIVKYGSCHYSPYHFVEYYTYAVSMLIFITTHY